MPKEQQHSIALNPRVFLLSVFALCAGAFFLSSSMNQSKVDLLRLEISEMQPESSLVVASEIVSFAVQTKKDTKIANIPLPLPGGEATINEFVHQKVLVGIDTSEIKVESNSGQLEVQLPPLKIVAVELMTDDKAITSSRGILSFDDPMGDHQKSLNEQSKRLAIESCQRMEERGIQFTKEKVLELIEKVQIEPVNTNFTTAEAQCIH